MTTRTLRLLLCLTLVLTAVGGVTTSAAAAEVPAGPQEPEQPPGAVIKTRVFLVNLFVTALDDDNYVRDLTEPDFIVYEDGEPQPIKYFNNLSESKDLPLTIIMLIDTSGSVVDKLQQEIATASAFLKHILRKNKDLAALIGFHSEVELLQDFTDDPDRLDAALSRLRPGGNTSLYDAIYLAAEDMLSGEAGRKIIVVLSDGADTSSRVKQEEAIRAAQKNDVLIYGLGVRSPRFQSDFRSLKKFTEETGGKFFSVKASIQTLRNTFDQIMTDIHHQYNIAYEPKNQARNGEYREIKVKVKGRRLDLYYRNGYFAPED